MTNLIGGGLLLYGGYKVLYTSVGTQDFNNGLVCFIGAIVYLWIANKEQILNFFKQQNTKVVAEQVFKPSEHEVYDNECLTHLRNRCLANNSKEGFETCLKLNNIVFSFSKDSNEHKTTESNTNTKTT